MSDATTVQEALTLFGALVRNENYAAIADLRGLTACYRDQLRAAGPLEALEGLPDVLQGAILRSGMGNLSALQGIPVVVVAHPALAAEPPNLLKGVLLAFVRIFHAHTAPPFVAQPLDNTRLLWIDADEVRWMPPASNEEVASRLTTPSNVVEGRVHARVLCSSILGEGSEEYEYVTGLLNYESPQHLPLGYIPFQAKYGDIALLALAQLMLHHRAVPIVRAELKEVLLPKRAMLDEMAIYIPAVATMLAVL